MLSILSSDNTTDSPTSWPFQLRHKVRTLKDLEQYLELNEEEKTAFEHASNIFRFGVTPYYLSLADKKDPSCPIRKQIVPNIQEVQINQGELKDPLGEESLEAAPNLIHRYKDRALLLVTDHCPVYCRFCTRRRIVGRTERTMPRALLEETFKYLREHQEIEEVILSGGDALMLADKQLEFILTELRSIAHIQLVRIATRMPVTCPMRITQSLVDVIRKTSPLVIMTHFNHPKECTNEAKEACDLLRTNGIPVYNQTVLLRGINDNVETQRELNRALLSMGVRVYYLHQCDMSEGIEHFRTPLSKGIEIIRGLRGHLSGLAIPQFCVDIPGGLGKVTLVPESIVEQCAEKTIFRSHTGQLGEYFDPVY